MKRKLFSIMAIAAIAMTSCKKEEVLDSNQLGEATIKGNILSYLDETNDVDANGLFVLGSTPEKVEGMVVSIEVDTKTWDQTPDNSYTYPKKTYTATTDANGDFTITLPATEKAENVNIYLGEMAAVQKKYTTDGTEINQDVILGGNWLSADIFSGAVLTVVGKADINTAVNAVNNEYGEATIRIITGCDYDFSNGGPDDLTTSSIIGQTVSLSHINGYNPTGNSTSSSYTGTFIVDPADNTKVLAEIKIPTYAVNSSSATAVYIHYGSFQGTYVDGGGTTGNAIWEPNGGSLQYQYTIYDGDIITAYLVNYMVTPN